MAIAAAEAAAASRQPVICPLCERPIPPHAKSSRHHLVPRLKGGTNKGTVRLHQICHSAIHARFSEAELARHLADVEILRADPELAAFIDWVRTKPADFHAPTRLTKERRQSRKNRD
ncbi:restriction endonuclease [Devosia chinhatensis]|uniref:Restriction endonuclease n=1 Tax=Devosia chinhatensis TaxID=429727 RepID=A0A0F5FHN3_9HYPH|nr:restriction endonuclease [Devosia chinhatensis]KKB08308.1 restriction endonuclease [Devosia chinhatensis]